MTIGGVKFPGAVDPRLACGGTAAPAPPAQGFANVLQDALRSVDGAQAKRDAIVGQAVTGQVGEVHDVMAAAEEAQLAFELMLEVRNKLLESYSQIMQMQV